jgi:hypothetical protein
MQTHAHEATHGGRVLRSFVRRLARRGAASRVVRECAVCPPPRPCCSSLYGDVLFYIHEGSVGLLVLNVYISSVPAPPLIPPLVPTSYPPDTPLMHPSLPHSAAAGFGLRSGDPRGRQEVDPGRGLHLSTFRLNVRAFCGIGGAFRG